MSKLNLPAVSLLFLSLLACSSKNSEETILKTGNPIDPKNSALLLKPKPTPAVVPSEVKAEITNTLYTYPELTTLLAVKDVNLVIKKIEQAGGVIIYNPNRGHGSSIGFLIANLPPEKILDDNFIKSLDLKAISFELGKNSQVELMGETPKTLTHLSVPYHEIGINNLREQLPEGNTRGEDVLVGVIDTGIDAAHPAFQDRVIYWQDLTQEGDIRITPVALDANNTAIMPNKLNIKLPDFVNTEVKIFGGIINEKALAVQIGDAGRTADKDNGIDLNKNGTFNDKFPFILAQEKVSGKFVVLVDKNNTGDLSKLQTTNAIMDFNDARSSTKNDELKNFAHFLEFPSSNKIIKYPLIIHLNEQALPRKISIGADFDGHGTHVAGIIGANGLGLQGAATKAKFMALKVCSGITCSNQAILRALVDAFYNSKGLIPDIINISLGSKQGYTIDLYSYVLRDLAAKFGTTFFISASNSGPGIRSINSLGHFGPIVSVGAHVSKNSLIKHYDVNPNIDLPDHGVFGFSSAGPNYTGELRPNIVAPGSALSSTPLSGGGADMYNGTSMSSPLAAGGAAVMLGVLKQLTSNDEKLQKVFKIKNDKIKDVLNQTQNFKGLSLIDFPLALRNSLELTAKTLPFHNILRQGYGLIAIDKAVEILKTNLSSMIDENGSYAPLGFTDFKLNQNLGANASQRLYDRSVDISSLKTIDVDIEEDGERGQDFLIERFKATPMLLKLVKVEVENSLGEITILKDDLPFSIASPGLENQNARERELLLGTSLKKAFISHRHLHKMQAGNTYIAVYEIYQLGKKILTLTDVVQKPFEFSSAISHHQLPSISTDIIQLPASMSIKDVQITPNRNHRIPVAIRSGDQALLVTANIAEGENGSVLINVYDADGLKVSEATLRRSAQSPLNTGIVKLKIPTSAKPGIYEIIISTSSGRWMGTTKYDLLMRVSRFQADKKKLNLATQSVVNSTVPSTDYITVLNTALQTKALTIKQESFTLIESLKPFPVSSGNWTFKKIIFPEVEGLTTTNVLLEDRGGDQLNCITRIDHNLYSFDATQGGFKVATSTEAMIPSGAKLFSNVNSQLELYAAVETLMCGLPEAAALGVKTDQRGLNIEASFPGITAIGGALDFNTIVKNSTGTENNRFLILIQAPKALALRANSSKKESSRLRGRANFVISSDDNDLKENIEISLFQ